MGIELIRIDDRLIHGQVVLGWTRSKGINTVVAVDDEILKNKMQCQLMKMATPPGVTPIFLSVEEAAAKLTSDAYKNKKAMLLVKGPKTLVELMNKGVDIKNVNVGNVRPKNATEQLFNHVFSTKEDIAIWKELCAKGVSLTAQALPDAATCNLNDVLAKY